MSKLTSIHFTSRILCSAFIGLSGLLLTGCADLANSGGGYYDPNPSYGGGGSYYDDRYDRGRDYDYRRRRDALRDEREDINRERERLEDERRRLEEDRRTPPPSYAPPPPRPRPEHCPAGFRPSEQKCSPKERRNGCQDMRLPGGLGCVKR